MGIRFRESCNITSELLIINGAKHAYCYEADREKFFRAVTDFFDSNMNDGR